MADEIKVYVLDESGREFYRLAYKDPLNGRKVRKTTQIPTAHDRGKAERAAQSWQDELNAGEYASPTKTTWAEFRRRLLEEKLANSPPSARVDVATALRAFERLMGEPQLLASVTTEAISRFHAKLEAERPKLSADTILTYLRRLVSALRWAAKLGFLKTAPKMPTVRLVPKSKGRPITAEEFERLLAAIPAGLAEASRKNNRGVGGKHPPNAEIVASWAFFLEGLWASGLRLGEALRLYWTPPANASTALLVELEGGKRPRLYIPGAGQKNRREQWLPIAPEFAELLESVPMAQRRGPVFRPLGLTGSRSFNVKRTCQRIAEMGRVAGIVVNTTTRKTASAHDLRRSFGHRWAKRVLPQILQVLMRHSNIQTTMVYYAGNLDDATADAVWDAWEKGPRGTQIGTQRPEFAPE